jgi:hypothetical protein
MKSFKKTKGVTRSRKQKDRKHNNPTETYKRPNNDPQSNTQKT